MDLVRLRALREFADRGTVHAAARALNRTPSAVSQQLRALQAEVGIPLTERTGRRLRLTDAGWALVRHADEVLSSAERVEAELDSYRSRPKGAVRVAMFPTGAELLLAGLMRRLTPVAGLRLECRDIDMQPNEVPALLADYDIVVTHRDEQMPPFDDARAEVVHLLREPLDVALPAGHRLAKRRKVPLTDLAEESWIGVDVGFPVDDVLRSLAVRTGVRPTVVQRINDFHVTERLVAAGLGVALLPRYTLGPHSGRRWVRRPLAGIRAARHVEAVLRAGASARPSVAEVLAALRAEATAIG
ncbi:DNA-binding transcriptional LysR family regulator [Tamaricihabitans halophyticus]|uniref:DNA-binding transcriptional LysR family regulator n=1 Tax=Tamaricihabitans halophyticus TaxID=1262583 RepID=A0A4R2QVW3_9PSEU|nr:LysR family transcriptional regulator [Tamaricihabitans halophyticus]TCP54213.1 DNA-binding transcriptional LysR family regulator [Tamaricihabitans halophyticus]